MGAVEEEMWSEWKGVEEVGDLGEVPGGEVSWVHWGEEGESEELTEGVGRR